MCYYLVLAHLDVCDVLCFLVFGSLFVAGQTSKGSDISLEILHYYSSWLFRKWQYDFQYCHGHVFFFKPKWIGCVLAMHCKKKEREKRETRRQYVCTSKQ